MNRQSHRGDGDFDVVFVRHIFGFFMRCPYKVRRTNGSDDETGNGRSISLFICRFYT